MVIFLISTLTWASGIYKKPLDKTFSQLVNFNGFMAKLLKVQGYNSDIGMYITDDGQFIYVADKTTTDYEYKQTLSLHKFLSSNGINMIYVNEPTKYTDDLIFRNSFGVESYSNRNMDLFLNRIRAAGINTIDLRDNIRQEGINVSDLFYRTDHHWTTSAGLWASKIMAEGLNRYCGYNVDLSIYGPENYDFKLWRSCWVGEQGRKVGITYSGLDDYTEIKPKFDTSYTFKKSDNTTFNGTFVNFIDENVYQEGNNDLNRSWHYSYKRINCINNNVSKGKVLMIADSYDHVTECFLSLGVHEIDTLVLRDCEGDFKLRDYITKNGYDTVIIAYAQHMVGSHDDPNSNNYRMFTFD